jgi:uncharacterized membrane protein (UPF0182 family)
LQRSTNIAGPSQVSSNFEAKPEVATSLSLLRQGGASVELGNLLTLPVGGGLLYVQPVYVRATANTAAYPLLQKVLVSFGDQIGYADTVKGALDQVFGGNAGRGVGAASDAGAGSTGNSAVAATVAEALARAKQALSDAQAALTKGDFTAYGKAQDALKQAISDAAKAESNAAKK